MRRVIGVVGVAMLLSACGDGVSGEYGQVRDGQWTPMLVLKDGMAEMDLIVTTGAGPYEVRNGKLYLTLHGGTHVLSIDREGCIDGMMFGRMCRQP